MRWTRLKHKLYKEFPDIMVAFENEPNKCVEFFEHIMITKYYIHPEHYHWRGGRLNRFILRTYTYRFICEEPDFVRFKLLL